MLFRSFNDCTFRQSGDILLAKKVSGETTFNRCTIESRNAEIVNGYLNVNLTFNDCNIITLRKPHLHYQSIAFANCDITFVDNSSTETVNDRVQIIAYNTGTWSFTDCTLTSQKPILIGGTVQNPTIVGDVLVG